MIELIGNENQKYYNRRLERQKSKDGNFHSPEKISNELMRASFDELSPKYTMIFFEIAS